jgi:hypothetical protein
LLVNVYDDMGEIRSQTLADGRRLLYENGHDEKHNIDDVKLTLPDGYVIRWILTRNGFKRFWPEPRTNDVATPVP